MGACDREVACFKAVMHVEWALSYVAVRREGTDLATCKYIVEVSI